MSNTHNTLIFIIIFFLLGMYIYYTDSIEGFAVDTATNDAIKKAVNDIYLADVDAIRNLSEVATKLQTAGLTLPGDFTVKGKINVDKDINTTGKLKENGNDLISKGTIVAYHPPNFTDATTDIVIPGGWALCDGTNGTPDLRGRFIKGVSSNITNDAGLSGFNNNYVVGKKINNKSGVDDGILGISRTNKNSWIFKMKHGDYGGTDHMVLSTSEMPRHKHGDGTLKTADKFDPRGNPNGSDDRNGKDGKWEYLVLKSGKQGSVPDTQFNITGNTGETGENWGHNNLPPYYVLTYIMKL